MPCRRISKRRRERFNLGAQCIDFLPQSTVVVILHRDQRLLAASGRSDQELDKLLVKRPRSDRFQVA